MASGRAYVTSGTLQINEANCLFAIEKFLAAALPAAGIFTIQRAELILECKGSPQIPVPPKKIEGIGDEAFWASNRFGGVLYVLKGDAFISISLGGPDSEQTKIDKSKALAKKPSNICKSRPFLKRDRSSRNCRAFLRNAAL
jgi:hypothetical protein